MMGGLTSGEPQLERENVETTFRARDDEGHCSRSVMFGPWRIHLLEHSGDIPINEFGFFSPFLCAGVFPILGTSAHSV